MGLLGGWWGGWCLGRFESCGYLCRGACDRTTPRLLFSLRGFVDAVLSCTVRSFEKGKRGVKRMYAGFFLPPPYPLYLFSEASKGRE